MITATDFCDPKTGEVITDIRKLSKRARAAIEKIEQKKTISFDVDGNEITVINTTLRLVPKFVRLNLMKELYNNAKT